MGRRLGAAMLVGGACVVVLASNGLASADPGMLTAKDVGLPVLSKPHDSTVIVYDDVIPGTCESADDVEHDAVVASFGTKSGPVLNEVVFELGSPAEATSFFTAAEQADQVRAECGTTANATILGIKSGPKGVGDDRYTVTSEEDVGGTMRKAIAVHVVTGSRVVAINFLDWTKSQPPTKKVLKRALTRLG